MLKLVKITSKFNENFQFKKQNYQNFFVTTKVLLDISLKVKYCFVDNKTKNKYMTKFQKTA